MIISITMRALTGTFVTDMKRAEKETARAARQMQREVEAAGKAMGAALAAAAIGVVAMVKHALDAADELGKLSQKVGISTESLSVLKHQAKLADVEIDALQTSLVKFNKSIADAAGGSRTQAETFKALGISLKDANGNLKTSETLLLEVAEKFSGFKDSAAKTAIAVNLFGRAGADLIPLLNEGAAGFEAAREEAEKFGLIVSTEASNAAQTFNDNMTRLTSVAEGFGNQVTTALLPALTAFSDEVVGTSKNSDELANSAKGVAVILTKVMEAGIIVKNVLDGLGITIIAIGKSAWQAGILLAQMFTAPARAAAAFAADGIDGVKSVMGEIAASAESAKATWAEAWSAFKQGWSDAGSDIMAGVAALEEGLSKPIEKAAEATRELADAPSVPMLAGGSGKDGKGKDTDTDEALKERERALESLISLNNDLGESITVLEEQLAGATNAQMDFNRTQREAAKALKAAGGAMNPAALAAYVRAMASAKTKLDLSNQLDASAQAAARLEEVLDRYASNSPMQQLSDDIGLVEEAIAGAKAGLEEFANVDIGKLEQAAKSMRIEMGQRMLSVTNESLRGIQSLTEEGSKSYAQLQVAIDAVTVAEAVLAVIHQASSGDVYTAIPRMIAMIAAIESLGVSVGNLSGGGGSESAASRQATQGTGTVLGDSEAKSESIANAVEITADATSKLVGINTGMLQALKSLQQALGAAGGQLARGALNVDFGSLADDMEAPVGGPIGNAIIGWVHGGSQSIIDQGILIAGGALTDMLTSIAVGAYATIETDGGLFGSDSTDDRLSPVSEEFSRQFQLVIQSISDAVSEGAEALGLLPADIEAAMAQFRVEEIRISLMDLSAEEQQAELEAVFSSIFDGLAGSVVPFIGQFQQVGEGLGETLVRVATEVQVFQEAIGQLGLVVDETDPERFAQIADGMIQAVGSIEDFITGMESFVNAFSNDAYQFEIATDAIHRAFENAGLSIPATRDAMFDLMQSLDATTAEGREQIATLLRLADTASEYYDALEEFQKLPGELMQELGQSGGFTQARAEIEKWERETIAGLNAIARAQGRQAASEIDLANAHAVAAQRVAQLIARLKEEAADLAVQLGYITGTDTLESLNAQIDAMGSASGDAADAIGKAVDGMREKMNLLLGDLSPFNDQKKLELALEGLRAGTVDPETVLEIGRRLYASTSQYTDLFNMVMGMAQFGGGGMTPGSDTSADGRTLQELIAARDALLAAQRPDLADDLAHRIAELAAATGDSFAEVAQSMGFDLSNIANDLNISNDQLNELLEQYMAQFEALDFGSLTESLTTNYTENTDRIVAAIEGKAVADAVAQADAEAADRDAANTAQQSTEDRLTAIETAINSQTSALISAGMANTDREVDAQNGIGRELREANLRYFAEADRRIPVMVR